MPLDTIGMSGGRKERQTAVPQLPFFRAQGCTAGGAGGGNEQVEGGIP